MDVGRFLGRGSWRGVVEGGRGGWRIGLMELRYAIDELYATGWSALDTSGCGHDEDGRAYPREGRVRAELAGFGSEFMLERVDEFDCFRAVWTGGGIADDDVLGEGGGGAVVAKSAEAVAVFALARARREDRTRVLSGRAAAAVVGVS